jgi:hypothetical protein
MTTADTTMRVRNGLRKAHAYPLSFAPVVFVLIHRSDVNEVEGTPVISLAHYDIWNVPKEKLETCPLCLQGSEAILPKGANWRRLKGLE